MKGLERSFLHVTPDKPTIGEIEPSSEVIMIEGSSREDLKAIRVSPMILDNDGELKYGLKWLKEDDNDDERFLNIKHIKRVQLGDVLETMGGFNNPKRRAPWASIT